MKYLLVCICLIATMNAEGQTSWRNNRHARVMHELLRHQQKQAEAALARTTTTLTKTRVKAQSTRDNTLGSLADSVNVQYSGGHSSIYDYSNMIYPYNYPYAATPMFNLWGVFTTPQVYYDQYAHWTVNPFTNVYGLYEGATATYDTNNITDYLHLFADSVINKNMKYSNTFTASNKIASGYWYIEHSGILDSAFKQFFTYNTAGLLVQDSVYEWHLGAWHIAGKSYYTYDGSNNLVQIDNYDNATDTSFTLPLVESEKYVNTYDASNRLHTVLTYLYDGTSLTASIKDTFDYTGTGTFHTGWRQHQYDAINHYWAPILNMQKHLNAANLPDTVSTMAFDSILNAWIPNIKDIVSYDTANRPDTIWEYLYDFTAFPTTPDFTTVYYYETYTVPVGVEETPNSNAVVFPNPAGERFYIVSLDALAGEAINIVLVNANGQVVNKAQATWNGRAEIDATKLAPGSYWLSVYDSHGRALHSQQVIH